MNDNYFIEAFKTIIVYLGAILISLFFIGMPALLISSIILHWGDYLTLLFATIVILEFIGITGAIIYAFKE